jgi:hypothetical protein
MGSSNTTSTSKYPKPGIPSGGYVNIVLDVECAETLLVALSYALGVEGGKKKKKKKKKGKGKTTPEPKTSSKTGTTPKPQSKTSPKPK